MWYMYIGWNGKLRLDLFEVQYLTFLAQAKRIESKNRWAEILTVKAMAEKSSCRPQVSSSTTITTKYTCMSMSSYTCIMYNAYGAVQRWHNLLTSGHEVYYQYKCLLSVTDRAYEYTC